MSNAVQVEAETTAAPAGSGSQSAVAERVYKVVAPAGGASHEDLYGFRATMMQPAPVEDPEAAKNEAKSKRALALFPILILLVLGVLAFLLIPKFSKSKAPLYVDLETRRFDSAGLGARLIARWEGNTAYQLYIDPLDPQQTAGFQAVVVNPPHPVSVVIRLLDATGAVACQKEVALPTPAPAADASDASSADISAALAPMPTASGDTIQNIANPDGQIAEITITGGLPCSMKQYQSVTSWEFFTNFPSLEEQDEWLKHHKPGQAAKDRNGHGSNGGYGVSLRALHLPAAIDDDDVIVGDNPSQGTIDTQGGRVFWLGLIEMRNRSAEWTVFPASVHFHCDKNGNCVLTRVNSQTSLQARLVK